MEIISVFEPIKWGIYVGAIGYLDFVGNLDCCITIWTIALRGDRVYVQVGVGIVVDFDFMVEYNETRHKVSAFFRALELV